MLYGINTLNPYVYSTSFPSANSALSLGVINTTNAINYVSPSNSGIRIDLNMLPD